MQTEREQQHFRRGRCFIAVALKLRWTRGRDLKKMILC